MHIVKRRYQKNAPTLSAKMSIKADEMHKIRKFSGKSGRAAKKIDVSGMHIIRIYAKTAA